MIVATVRLAASITELILVGLAARESAGATNAKTIPAIVGNRTARVAPTAAALPLARRAIRAASVPKAKSAKRVGASSSTSTLRPCALTRAVLLTIRTNAGAKAHFVARSASVPRIAQARLPPIRAITAVACARTCAQMDRHAALSTCTAPWAPRAKPNRVVPASAVQVAARFRYSRPRSAVASTRPVAPSAPFVRPNATGNSVVSTPPAA
jgi:hypothetical protein